jgi:hypothetical protein
VGVSDVAIAEGIVAPGANKSALKYATRIGPVQSAARRDGNPDRVHGSTVIPKPAPPPAGTCVERSMRDHWRIAGS